MKFVAMGIAGLTISACQPDEDPAAERRHRENQAEIETISETLKERYRKIAGLESEPPKVPVGEVEQKLAKQEVTLAERRAALARVRREEEAVRESLATFRERFPEEATEDDSGTPGR